MIILDVKVHIIRWSIRSSGGRSCVVVMEYAATRRVGKILCINYFYVFVVCFFFFQAEDGIRDLTVTGVQTCALPISGVDPNSVAAEHGLKTGDVITEAGGKKVASPADIRTAIGDAQKEGKRTLLDRKSVV